MAHKKSELPKHCSDSGWLLWCS